VSLLAVVVVLEKRGALLSVVIGVCVGCTCDSGWCGRPVRWVDAAECAAWTWWRCTVMFLCPIEDRGESYGRLSSVEVLRVLLGDGCVACVLGLFVNRTIKTENNYLQKR
jgi:hypothetical protein